jgi:hypothetical protein
VNERETIPFDGMEENAGIIQDFPDHSSEITPSARDRYNDLVLNHYGLLKYPFYKDHGVTIMENGNYLITPEAKELWYSFKLEKEGVKQ